MSVLARWWLLVDPARVGPLFERLARYEGEPSGPLSPRVHWLATLALAVGLAFLATAVLSAGC